jgi:hypothetical protein
VDPWFVTRAETNSLYRLVVTIICSHQVEPSILYRMTQDSASLYNVQLNRLEIILLLTELTKLVRNEILHVQRTTHSSKNRLAGLNVNIPVNVNEYFRLTDFWAILYMERFVRV